jgi:molecular chaperone DnaK
MTITGGSSLPKEDIDRMVREAEEHAAEDKKRREDADTRNQAESFAYSIEKLLKDNEDKISAEVKNEVQEALDASKKALEGDDIEEIKAKNETLSTVSQKIGEALYAQEQAAAAAGEQPAQDAEANDEDVVDAEIVDEEDSK